MQRKTGLLKTGMEIMKENEVGLCVEVKTKTYFAPED